MPDLDTTLNPRESEEEESGAMEPGEKTPEKISFKPITQGLGFHPFSDGLPYAPVSKAPRNSGIRPATALGTGAVSAGMARMVLPKPRPLAAASQPRIESPALPLKIAPPATVEPSLFVSEVPLSHLFKRATAYLIDSALNLSLCLGAFALVLWRINISIPQLLASREIVVLATLFFLFFNWALIAAQEIAFGTSVGKNIFRISLEGSASAIFLRAFFFLISVGFAGVGLFWGFFDRRHRCWHDIVVDLQPVEIAKL